jgi:hypothetical protein
MHPPDLPPGQQWAAAGKWPQVGERAPAAGPEAWTVRVQGEVQRPLELPLQQLLAWPQVELTLDVHCVTRWSQAGLRFAGIPLADVLALAAPTPAARFVSYTARSTRGHSTSLPLADALALGTLLATSAAGQPLAPCHGGPLRVVTPGRYFYKSLKWLEQIELLHDDRLGYWESQAGYHNQADPWREQRYLAPGLSRQEVAAVLALRDWSGRDLRSIDAAGRQLDGLLARGALLRDADFRSASLVGACFDKANLSNAHCQRANLARATFTGADVEGANFAGADLRGADFRQAALLAATFAEPGCEALIDGQTRFDAAALDALAPLQARWLAARLGEP